MRPAVNCQLAGRVVPSQSKQTGLAIGRPKPAEGENETMSVPRNLQGFHAPISSGEEPQAKATELQQSLFAHFGWKPARAPFVGGAGPHPVPQVKVIFR